jgi:hypothetical protein
VKSTKRKKDEGGLKYQNPKEYTTVNVIARWEAERAKWLKPAGGAAQNSNGETGIVSIASIINRVEFSRHDVEKVH